MTDINLCPCCSGKPFSSCCKPLLSGEKKAQQPEELMRSRYTAYVLKDMPYILKTWHPDTRPSEINPDTVPNWQGLRVLYTDTVKNNYGIVEFEAKAFYRGKTHLLHEKSRFKRENTMWMYVDGDVNPSSEKNKKVGRNRPCPCGSGKKFKKCCGP